MLSALRQKKVAASLGRVGYARLFSSGKNGLKVPNIAVAGASGAVGIEMLKMIESRGVPFNELTLFAHPDEKGETVEFMGKSYELQVIEEGCFDDLDIALFSAGGSISEVWAPKAVEAGCIVVDNSSVFRMDPSTPLVVPEVNAHAVAGHNGIIANPNCTTIIMNVPVYPLHKAFGVKRAVVSTYQAASGAGLLAMQELEQQAHDFAKGDPLTQDIFGRQYLWNLFSHNSDIYLDKGYNEEEWKMVEETPKIFETPFKVAVTCVRVPVLRAHCESINLEFERKVTLDEIYEVLGSAPGVQVVDDRAANQHPEPLLASNQENILVGRVRYDNTQGTPEDGYTGIEMFVAGDQLLKGAAQNAVQIAEVLIADAQ